MKRTLIVILLMSFAFSAEGKDFGKRVHSFPVKEEGFITMIKRKLQKVDLEKENKKMEQVATEKVENPTPVKGLSPATKDREFLHDPSYVLLEDAVLPCGKILYAAGTRVNPLDHMELERRLFFVDGGSQEQIEWLEERLENTDDTGPGQQLDMIILVGGSVFKTQERLKKTVYFDQSGELTTKFGIKASPALVEQEGKMLKVTEFNLSEEDRDNGK
jgi:conjugal transfer pilus assembly protein TraW